MKSKIVYQCDADGHFLGETIADESPLEPGLFLIPAGAVVQAPPAPGENERAKFDGDKWVLVAIPPIMEEEAEAEPPTQAEQIEMLRAIRRDAYRSESDPLKIEAEYDAVTSGTEPNYTAWLAKVAEIKSRYPLPATL